MTPGLNPTAAVSGYLAFTTALMLAVIAANQSIGNAPLIVGLLAASLPSLAAWLYAESIVWEGQEHILRVARWLSVAVGVAPSVTGLFLTVWNFSRLAAFLVLLEIPLWYLLLSFIQFLGED